MKARIWSATIVLLLISLCGQMASADRGDWPKQIDIGFTVNSRDEARFLLMGEGYGTVGEDLVLRLGGWIVHGEGTTKARLSNAYVGLDKPHFYAAVGQKFVVFGPAGLLVSPGARGAEVVLKGEPISLQLLGGTTQFTPPTGNAGRTTPNLTPLEAQERPREDFFAARAEYHLIRGIKHSFLGLNTLWMNSESGASVDLEAPAGGGRILYAEASSFDSTSAQLAGMRFTDVGKYFHTAKPTELDVFWTDIPDDYAPSLLAATQYRADRDGVGVGLYHRMGKRSALGIYGDGRGVMIDFSRHFTLH
ncbi:MAG: hypothetical protein GTO55_03035 [Armatimonadetes bacterium]|nr:hypothetical protein [Armatimonadota bacterium]NIM23250.1 hypothetical protein [Armatimonadota bacterium]NIM67118.1 hypothetical protein [Armatimonadota bacterium]NIM75645.1 hypothetical protein [Armatimonadota bacterium]NIN05307.1 hypothetical protein [Armatimonadota bacterium]